MSADSTKTPNFTALLWDNFKTTAVSTGIIGAVPGGFFGMMLGLPFGAPDAGAVFGGALTALPVGLIGGFALSVPFAISAQYTRQFKHNSLINPLLSYFSKTISIADKQRIIKDIITEDNKLSYLTIRSIESFNLTQKLNEKLEGKHKYDVKEHNTLTEAKWQTLLEYMNEKTFFGDAYVNNGKSLFNTILRVLIKYSENKPFQIRTAILNKDIPKIDQLLNLDYSLLWSDIFYGKELLHFAVCHNQVAVVKHILNHYRPNLPIDSRVGVENIPDKNKTALQIAAELGHTEITLALLAAGASPILGDLESHPIHFAAANGHLKLVQELVALDPSLINRVERDNNTPLTRAAANGHLEVVTYLVNKGADLNKQTNGKNALQLADEKNYQNVANFLSHKGCLDASTDRQKIELQRILGILSSSHWKDKGWGLFGNHTPARVARLREYVRLNNVFFQDLQDLNRQTTRTLVQHFQNAVQGEIPYNDQGDLYYLIRNLGYNTDENIARLQRKFPAEDQAVLRAGNN